MNIINNLLKAIRGGAQELGEAIVDTQSLRLFEQDIRDSKENLASAKEGLTAIVAKKIATERSIHEINTDITKNEGYALKALEQSNEALALEIADKIARLEEKNSQQQQELNTYQQNISRLKSEIQKAEKVIADHERELTMVKTRESVQQATKAVTQTVTTHHSSISSARESLERIKQKQQNEQDNLDAEIQLRKADEGDDLESKLKSAGIIKEKHSAEAVLSRLKTQCK